MKRKILNVGCALLVGFLWSSALQAAEVYKLDPNHTAVLWQIDHFGFSQPSGKWMVTEGRLVLDKNKPEEDKVSATIQVADVVTGVPELDKHLKGTLFFDVGKYPQATFESTKVVAMGKTKAKVYGNLTLHGVTKPIVLNVTFNKAGINPITNLPSVGFSATTQLKRSDFGITTLLPSVGDTVNINIQAEAHQG